MFLKRLSTALFALACFGGFVLGANPETVPNANQVVEENLFAAPLALGVSITANDISCFNENDGSIEVTVSDYVLPINWKLYNATTGALITQNTFNTNPPYTLQVSSKGKYYITVTDGSGGTTPIKSNTVEVVEPSDVIVSLENLIDIDCFGSTGTIQISAFGDYPIANYYVKNTTTNIQSSSVDGNFSGLTGGNYQAWVIDTKNCPGNYNGSTVLKLNEPSDLSLVTLNETQIPCYGDLGSVTINNLPVNAGYNAYSIELLNSTTSSKNYSLSGNQFVNLDPGSYQLTLKRNTCAPIVKSFTINAVTDIVINESVIGSVDCPGESVGVSVQITGGKVNGNCVVTLLKSDGTELVSPAIAYSSSHTFNNITDGSYTIIVKDQEVTTCTKSKSLVISGPASPIQFVSLPVQDSPSCYGENNGKVKFSVTGGTLDYKYWVDGVQYNDPSTISLSPNNHNIYIEDAKGCKTETQSFTIGETSELNLDVLDAQVEQLTCVDGSNGKIVVKTTGGNRPYLYTLNRNGSATSYVNASGDSIFSFTGLQAGNYTINVTDGVCASGATAQEEIITLDPIQVGYVLNPETVTCKDEPTTMWINAHEGLIGKLFTYSLYKNGVFVESKVETEYSTGVGFSELTPANYTVWIKYDDACDSLFQTVNIYNPKKFIVSAPDTIALNCYGDNAQAKITASGEYPFTYSLDGGSDTPFQSLGTTTISNLSAGVHDLILKDSKGCEYNGGAPVSIVVDEPNEIGVELQTPNPKVSCTGASDAEVVLQVTGGTPAFKVDVLLGGAQIASKLTDGTGLVTFNLPEGTNYNVVVTDIDKGCNITFPNYFTVVAPPTPFAITDVNIESPDLNCFGDSTRVEVAVDGGWGGSYSVNVQGGGINKTLPANNVIYLKAGTYNFVATDLDNGCIAERKNVVISQPKKLILSVLHHENVSCNGAADANISISVSGGTIPYYWGVNGVATIATSNEFSSNSLTLTGSMVPLPQGTYDLVVEDINGCVSNIKPVEIFEPNPITFETVIDTFVSCFGKGDATITLLNVKGGNNKNYQSLISTGGAEIAGPLTIRNLIANSYSVRVVDGSGACYSDPVNIEIKEPSEITWVGVPEIDDIKCFGVNEGRIKLDAAGGLPFTLEYRLTGGSFDSGYSTNNEFTDLAPGTYTAWVRNSKGNCAIQYGTALVVNNVAQLVMPDPAIINVSCNNAQDGSVKLSATGGTGQLTYTLTNALATVDNNPNNSGSFTGLGDANKNSTTYSYRVEDINQCYIEGSFTVENPPLLQIELTDQTDVVCHNGNDGTISLRVTGGTGSYTFKDMNFSALTYDLTTLATDEFRINKLGTTAASTMYLPSVMDANGCVAVLSTDVEIINPEKVEILGVDWGNKLCYGDHTDSTIIHAAGGTGHYYYSLDDGLTYSILDDSIFIGEAAGTKLPRIKDENSCTITGEKFEYEEPEALAVNYEFFPILCYDDTFGDMKLAISGGTGQYHLSINDANFISSNYTVDRALVDTTTFQLLENGIELSNDITYKFYLRDDNNCHVQNIDGVNDYSKPFAETVFTIPPKLVLVDLKQQGVACRNERAGKIEFEATGGTTNPAHGYVLTAEHLERGTIRTNSNGQYFVDNLFAGPYKCTLTDANGCIAETKLSPLFNYDTISVAYENDSINLTIAEIILPSCDMTFDGSIKIKVADYQFEGATAYVDFLEPALNEFRQFDEEDTIVADEDYKRVITSDYSLYYNNSQLIAEYMGIGRYIITIEDNHTHCTASIDTTIASIAGDSCPPIINYNVFTPHNGDNVNEDWIIRGLQHQEYRLQIYTSWGELVYSKHDVAGNEGVKWNGVDNKDRPVPVGTYIYLLEKYIGTPKDTITNGNITILRGDGKW